MKALFVIDVQKATIGKTHDKFFKYDEELINRINKSIEEIETVVKNYLSIEAWPSSILLKEEGLNKLMDIMELANELDKRAPYDKIVTKEFA